MRVLKVEKVGDYMGYRGDLRKERGEGFVYGMRDSHGLQIRNFLSQRSR